VEISRILAVLIDPFLPGTSAKMRHQLAWTGSTGRLEDAAWGGLEGGHKIGEPEALFPRRETRA
jgi:methionyl-tRNA synthetase